MSFDGILPIGFYALMPEWSSSDGPVVSDSFDGILPVGFYGLMMNWSGSDTPEPPVDEQSSKLPWTRRRRGR